MFSTSEKTITYIKEHPHIKHCLKKGLINYSSLARLISSELRLQNKSSIESILVSARRYALQLNKNRIQELELKKLLKFSTFEVKNKIVVYIINKSITEYLLKKIQEKLTKNNLIFYLLEGSSSYTLITEDLINLNLKNYLIKKTNSLALIKIKSGKEIEKVVGVVAYLTSLFSENNVNIIEFLSSWTDTFFVINSKDIVKAITFLNFE